MADFVSRSKVEFELCGGNLPEKHKAFIRRVLNDKNLVPTADVVPVVRCRDCKFMIPDTLPYAGRAYAVGLKCYLRDDYSIREDDYCSRGVLRGGDPDGR